MVRIRNARNNGKQLVVYFLVLLASQFSPNASTYENRYHQTSNLNLYLRNGETWSDVSKVQCAGRCSLKVDCNGFTWDAADRLCTIGTLAVLTGVIPSPIPSTTKLFINKGRAYLCDHIDFELRSNFHTSRCLHLSSTGHSYSNARDDCREMGGRLFKASSSHLIDLVVEMTLERPRDDHQVFIGLDDIKQEDMFVWSDGKSMTNEERALFAEGQPDNFDNEDCCTIRFSDDKLNDKECHSPERYVCEDDKRINYKH